ncbi:uncharacterized protein [Rutidosis leptorrhynchoides]|uniref:uncharacterized protein n=1 Tax=Rutidosis leptorrhynchoides TaxID=125765 RepID=UPI003A99F9BE
MTDVLKYGAITYFVPNFVLYLDHESLKYIHGQHKLNPRHAKWVKILQGYTISINHQGVLNKFADALSRKYSLLSTMSVQVTGFDQWRDMYKSDMDFKNICEKCSLGPFGSILNCDCYLFKNSQLCVLGGSIREAIITKVRAGGLAAHFGMNKTLAGIKMVLLATHGTRCE